VSPLRAKCVWKGVDGAEQQRNGELERRAKSLEVEAGLTRAIVGGAIAVHRTLGPGLLESAYRAYLACELELRGLHVETELPVRLRYRGRELDCGFRLDLVVNHRVIVELKSVRRFEPVHLAQLVTYVRLSGMPVGLLLNFNVLVLKDGIRRIVNPRTYEH
jgi:GxxExxY protein